MQTFTFYVYFIIVIVSVQTEEKKLRAGYLNAKFWVTFCEIVQQQTLHAYYEEKQAIDEHIICWI